VADLPKEQPDCRTARVSGSDTREVDTESELITARVRLEAGRSMAGSRRKPVLGTGVLPKVRQGTSSSYPFGDNSLVA
jgi:hypothetical protein